MAAPAPAKTEDVRSGEAGGLEHVSSSEDARPPAHHSQDGVFPGSFAGRATEAYAVPWYRRKEYFTRGWDDASIWRAAVVEAAATAMMTYISGQFGITIIGFGIREIAAYVGIFNAVLLSVFIYATAPASGGHINPLITWTTVWCGLCPAARGVLYILFQALGGAVGGGLLRGSWGYERAAQNMGGGCFFSPASITPGQVLLTEVISSWVMVFLGFGTGLDPRQAILFGPHLGPLLVGLSLGIVTSATTGTANGYAGANMNPSRCLALSVARGEFSYHWIWWIGPALGGLLNAALYNFAPPYHAETAEKRASHSAA